MVRGANQLWRCTKNWRTDYQLYLLMAGIMAFYWIFRYRPMYGLRMAFMEYNPILGFDHSPWVGLAQFMRLFSGPYFLSTLSNTLVLSLYSLIVSTPFPILFALIINAVEHPRLRSFVQTVTYAPHFISLVVMVGMFKLFLSPSNGIVNKAIEALGGESINFFAKAGMFPHLYVWTDVWQNTGWNAVIYIAALSGVDPELHEAATVDGASRICRIRHIDLPSILPTILILLIMHMGSLINVGFEKVFLMQTDLNLRTSEIISTYSYKLGLEQAEYSFSSAVGMFNSVVTFALLMFINAICKRITGTSLW